MTIWLALDVGDKRVGLAVGGDAAWLARPLSIIQRRSKREDFDAIARLAMQHDADRFLIGLPYNMDGSEGPQARRVRNYAGELVRHTPLPHDFWDERLSSFEADEIIAQSARKRRPHNDDVAAAAILQSYLDHLRPQLLPADAAPSLP